MKPVVIAAILSLLCASRAAAADVDLPAPVPRAPANYLPAAPVNWGGVYIGTNGGYGFGSSNWNFTGLSTGNFVTNGFLLGGTLGVNYAIGSGFVFGVEGDMDWSTLRGNSSTAACAGLGAPPGAACDIKSEWLSTARVRAGYAFDRIFLFATGGAAIGDLQVALNPPAAFVSTTQLGWTLGAGVEYAFADNVTAKVEYLYVDLGTATCIVAACGTITGATVSLTENLVRAGVNYKFSW